jgi:hypothetical protein
MYQHKNMSLNIFLYFFLYVSIRRWVKVGKPETPFLHPLNFLVLRKKNVKFYFFSLTTFPICKERNLRKLCDCKKKNIYNNKVFFFISRGLVLQNYDIEHQICISKHTSQS